MRHSLDVLVVDDDPIIARLFDQVLRKRGLHVAAVETGRQALHILRGRDFELVILDLSLADYDGLELLRQVRFEFPAMKILVVSGFMSGAVAKIAITLGASGTLAKPATSSQILAAVDELLGTRESGFGQESPGDGA